VAIFVLAHGAWSAAWTWKKVRPLVGGRTSVFHTRERTCFDRSSTACRAATMLDSVKTGDSMKCANLSPPSTWWLWPDGIVSVAQSPSAGRVCCSFSSPATLLSERRTSLANGACGR
jgi:hypothetical protein